MFASHLLKILFGTAFLIAGNSFAFGLRAKSDKVKVFTEPAKGADVLTTLRKNEIVTSIGRKGMYWKVETDAGKQGFVSVMKVRRQAGGESKVNMVLREAAEKSRESGENGSIRSRSAVMGVRGLDASQQVAFAGNMKPDYRLVFRMEDRMVSNKKISKLEASIYSEIEKKEK